VHPAPVVKAGEAPAGPFERARKTALCPKRRPTVKRAGVFTNHAFLFITRNTIAPIFCAR